MAVGPSECIKYMANPNEYIAKAEQEFGKKPGELRAKLEILNQLSKAFNFGKYENFVELARNMF